MTISFTISNPHSNTAVAANSNANHTTSTWYYNEDKKYRHNNGCHQTSINSTIDPGLHIRPAWSGSNLQEVSIASVTVDLGVVQLSKLFPPALQELIRTEELFIMYLYL